MDTTVCVSKNIAFYNRVEPIEYGQFSIDVISEITRPACITRIYLKNSKITINSNDIKTGLKAVVNADALIPTFSSQGKAAISNPDLRKFIFDLTKKSLDAWSKVNSTDLNKLCKYFKDIAEIRIKLESGKTRLSTQYEKSAISGDPQKYVKATGKDHLELFIVEGDSALGSAMAARNHETMAVFPIRGKIINAFTTPKARFFANEEVAAITKIITGLDRYDPNFDPAKSRFDKIIMMTDADADKLCELSAFRRNANDKNLFNCWEVFIQ